MPTYGYRCRRGHHFEVLQRITDAPLGVCPECQAPATRVFYPVGIIFKGQGFYKTDSRGGTDSSPSTTTGAETKAPTVSPSKDGQKEGSATTTTPAEEKKGS